MRIPGYWQSLFCLLFLGTIHLPVANGQIEELFEAPVGSIYAAAEIERLRNCQSSTQLLENLEQLLAQDALGILGSGNLPSTTLALPGWRWETPSSNGGRIVLAIEGPLLVAIYESPRADIQLSVHDLSQGRAVARGYAGSSRYFGHDTLGRQHVTAMSPQHLSHKSPEMFKIYFRYAAPSREIVNSKSLPRPAWALQLGM